MLELLSNLFNLKIKLKWVCLAIIVFVASAASFTYFKVMGEIGGKENFGFVQKYIEARDIIENRFIEESDDTVLGDAAIAAMVSGLRDPWSYYMSEKEYSNYKLSGANNDFANIGFNIIKTENGEVQVTAINPGSAASIAGLYVGAIITGVDNTPVAGMDIDDVRTLIRTKMNTAYYLRLGDKQDLQVDCQVSYVSPVSWEYTKTEAGYIKIENFEAGSGQAIVDAVQELLYMSPSGLCFDVRNNSGGLWNELQIALNYLLPAGTLFSKVDKQGNQTPYTADTMCISIPIAVIVNSETCEAAEFFAAVLQENGVAHVIGEPTKGSANMQQNIELSDGSAIRLSTYKYLTGKGTDISKTGVIPDEVAYDVDDITDIDEQYDAAMKHLSITTFK